MVCGYITASCHSNHSIKATFPHFPACSKAPEACDSARWGTRSHFHCRASHQLSQRHVLAGALIRGRFSSSAGMILSSSVPAVGARTSAPCGLVCCAKKPLPSAHWLWPEAGDFQPLHRIFSLDSGLSSVLAPIPSSRLGEEGLALGCICCW